MLPSDQLQASLDIHLLDATISIAGCTRVERGNGASPCSSRLTPACRMLLYAFTSLSFLHLRRCSTHSVDLHLMLRGRCPHFCASFWQPAHSVVVLCCVVLCSGVANTCTCRFAIFATSCTGSVSSSFPLGSTCAMPCITTSTFWSRIDSQKLSSTFPLALVASKRRLATLCLLCGINCTRLRIVRF